MSYKLFTRNLAKQASDPFEFERYKEEQVEKEMNKERKRPELVKSRVSN